MQAICPSAAVPPGNRLLFRFILVATLLYLGWFLGYEQRLARDGHLDTLLCNQLSQAGGAMLRVLGFAATIDAAQANLVVMNGQPAVIIGAACNGLVLYALFGGFVLAFPGPWQHKLWFVPLGIALIWVLNVLRVVVLALNHHYAHKSVDFNHHYTFNVVVYGFIFGLWMMWARRLATLSR